MGKSATSDDGRMFWMRYAPELDWPIRERQIDELLERSVRGANLEQGMALRLCVLWVYMGGKERDRWVHRMMGRAARLGDPYSILWCAELRAMKGSPERAYVELHRRHLRGQDPMLDNVVAGLLAGWAWREWGSARHGERLPGLVHTTPVELVNDTARWFQALGEFDAAYRVFDTADHETGERLPRYYLARWLWLSADRIDEAEAVAEQSAESDCRSRRLLGEIALVKGDKERARQLFKSAADEDRTAARLLRRLTRRAKRARAHGGAQGERRQRGSAS